VAHPLSGLGSLSEFHPHITAPNHDPSRNHTRAPLPRFLPLRRFSTTKSHLAPAVPKPPVTLRPQGFSPSRRFAPLAASRAYSIPDPSMGFYPSRPFSSPGAVRPLGRRAPQGFLLYQKVEEAALSGTLTPNEAPAPVPGTSRRSVPNASLGFPASRLTALGSEERSHALSSPLALSRLGRKLTAPPAPQGFSLPRTRPFSLERSQPPCSFPPRYSSRLFGDPTRLGYRFPSEADPRRREPLLIFA
jgi:hypothetical protein